PARAQPLLIDEVENGIHYATLPLLWKFLFEVAERHAIQIFATSHSWDCIEAFQTAAVATGKTAHARLIRLEARNAGAKAVVSSGDELTTVTRDRIEVRCGGVDAPSDGRGPGRLVRHKSSAPSRWR